MKKTIAWEITLPPHLKKIFTEQKYLEKSRQKKERQTKSPTFLIFCLSTKGLV